MPAMVIVGAGECGVRAALALREQGFDGPVMLVGEEAHLPYERPPLSKDALTAPEVPTPRTIADAGRLEAAGIAVMPGRRVVAIDPADRSITLDGGETVAYWKLLLATGAEPRRFAQADGLSRVAYLRTFDDALAIRARMTPGARLAVIGGGFIGLELAAAATGRGAAVTVIEAQARILMRGVPTEIAAIVQGLHEAAGVEFLCGRVVATMEDEVEALRITLDTAEVVTADLAVVGIGAVPRTALASAAGLAIDNGIAVDHRLRTSHDNIFAAGDCCSFPLALYGGRRVRLEAWRNAQDHGALAARAMLGADAAHDSVPWFWSDQYDHSLQVAGLVDEGRETVRRDLGGGAVLLFHRAADGRLVAASGIGPGNAVARDIRLAELLIAQGARPSAAQLAAPEIKLRSLLRP